MPTPSHPPSHRLSPRALDAGLHHQPPARDPLPGPLRLRLLLRPGGALLGHGRGDLPGRGRPARLQAPHPARRHPPAPGAPRQPLRRRPLRALLLRRRRLRQALDAAQAPPRRARAQGQRLLAAGAHPELLPLPRGEGPAAQGVRRVGQHGARQALEGLPHRHRELDRRPAPAHHRQPPEARLRQQGRDQAVLPRRGTPLRQERRAPHLKAGQRPAVSSPSPPPPAVSSTHQTINYVFHPGTRLAFAMPVEHAWHWHSP